MFSILKHSRYDRRSRWKPETLDAILRIRMNGAEIKECDAIRYARLWAKEGRMLTDAPASATDKEAKDSRAEQREDMEDKELLPDISSGKFANKKYLKGSNSLVNTLILV